jgi:hypothetical protein
MAIRNPGFSGSALEQDGVGRAVAFEHLERHQIADLLQGLTSRQELGFDRSLLLPKARASVWAKKLASSFGWWSPIGLWLMAGARKSQGISLVPWWISW